MSIWESERSRAFAMKHGVKVTDASQLVEIARSCSPTGDLIGWDSKGRIRARFQPWIPSEALVIYNERRSRGSDGTLYRRPQRKVSYEHLAMDLLHLAWMVTLRWCPPGTRGWGGQPLELLALEMFRES